MIELLIPDGAQVHITVSHPPLLALTQDQRPVLPDATRSGNRLLTMLGVAVVIVVAFEAGRLLPHRATTAAAATPSAPTLAAPGAVERDRSATDIPPAFRAQMAHPPQVIPPPGADLPNQTAPSAAMASPPAARAAPNRFGLQE